MLYRLLTARRRVAGFRRAIRSGSVLARPTDVNHGFGKCLRGYSTEP